MMGEYWLGFILKTRCERPGLMTLTTRGGEGREDKNKNRKATRSEGRGRKRVLVALMPGAEYGVF